MNPLAAIAAAFIALQTDLRTRFNAALGKLPPLEQIEGGNAVLNIISSIDWAKERLDQCTGDVEGALAAACSKIAGFEKQASEPLAAMAARLHDAMLAGAASAAIAAGLEDKSLITLVDHAAAIAAAKDTAGTAAELSFNAKLVDLATIATRRSAANEQLGVLASAALTDAVLLSDHHAELLATLETRVASLAAVGITQLARPLGFASLLAVSLDDAGSTEFAARLAVLQESAPVAVPIAAPVCPLPSLPPSPLFYLPLLLNPRPPANPSLSDPAPPSNVSSIN